MSCFKHSRQLLCLALLVTGCHPAPVSQQNASEAASAAASIAAIPASGAWRKPQIAGCAISALSIEDDPAGLNVHAEPSPDSKVIGKLYSLVEAPPDEEPLPSDPMTGPAFTIIAVKGDWVRIADIAPHTGGFDRQTRKYGERRNFQGLGWVHQSRIRVASDYWDKAFDRPYYQAAPWTVIDEDAGVNLYPWAGESGGEIRILACEKDWVKLRYPRIATRVSCPDSVRYFTAAERAQKPPVEGWLKSEAHPASAAPCDAADPDCPARRAREWD